ncbi:MAG: glutamine-hydrolyzing GMP synthase [Spirochaetales bacterium]|nr:glutamine-hydrolyzing GMP synthase [Spirochaetales bacterium]
MDKIIILDFGSQTTQLISRRVRDFGVYSEVLACDTNLDEYDMGDVKGIILSGSPYGVADEDPPTPHESVYKQNIPLLGICYGFQRMSTDFNGQVKSLDKTEYGRSKVAYVEECPLFTNIPEGFVSWMSHGDSVEKVGEGFSICAKSEHHIAAAWDKSRQFFGIQFHPEVTHCEYGVNVLENFAVEICGAKREWDMDQYFEMVKQRIIDQADGKPVLLLISGGVDSTVVGGLLLKALPSDQVYLMYVDTGLMRKNESAEVERFLKSLGAKHLYMIDAEERFLTPLKGVEEPEKKRHIIGDMFVTVQEQEISKILTCDYILAQGTLYTDLIESGKGVGKKAHLIKSHHNVKSPLIEAKRNEGKIIEPLDCLYKDEVRRLGSLIGLSDEIVHRHPFPGPGLGVRIIGEVTKEKCEILREADFIFIDELRKRNLYDKIWQAFCVLLPIRSVGVAGDARNYGYVLALRAIISKDGMSADVYPFEMQDLLEISSLITNSIRQIGRVVYDISSKPPATIEWE